MNFLLQKNDDRINSAIPKAMRDLIKKLSIKKNMSESTYIKLAINNQIIRDLEEE
jgi:hypothetical protein